MGYDGPVEPSNYGASRRLGPLMDVLVFGAGALLLLLVLSVAGASLMALAAIHSTFNGLGHILSRFFLAWLGELLAGSIVVVYWVLVGCVGLLCDGNEWPGLLLRLVIGLAWTIGLP